MLEVLGLVDLHYVVGALLFLVAVMGLLAGHLRHHLLLQVRSVGRLSSLVSCGWLRQTHDCWRVVILPSRHTVVYRVPAASWRCAAEKANPRAMLWPRFGAEILREPSRTLRKLSAGS